MAVTFATFVAQQYANLPLIRALYPNAREYESAYVNSNGLSSWLESMAGETLSVEMTENIAKVYIQYCGRAASDIPSLLVGLSRYGISLPGERGLLTAEYWESKVARHYWAPCGVASMHAHPHLEVQSTWQTRARGSNDGEYAIYLAAAESLGWTVKTYEQWLNS